MGVTIVNYGMGNLTSVRNALQSLGAEAAFAATPAEVAGAERIILPGVGAFGEAMARLREQGLIEPLRALVMERRRPFLGICLGMQLIGGRSFEHGEHEGLGWIAGDVTLIRPSDPALTVPHIGWNDVAVRRKTALTDGVESGTSFYFVHSYQLQPADAEAVIGTTDHGGEVVAMVARDNVFGTQFHPEKSHRAGLTLLGNFLKLPC